MDSSQPVAEPERQGQKSLGDFIKDHWLDYLFLLVVAGVIIALDQWTKALVRANIPLGSDWVPKALQWLAPYARVRYWHNSGAAFGLFQQGNTIFTILAIVVDCFILYYFPRVPRQEWWLRVAMAMQLAGASGNVIDRFAFKQVTDFISVGNFAVFNVADSSITVGVAIMILGFWIMERQEKKKALENKPVEAETKSE